MRKKYKIEKINDIFQIPTEKLPQFLKEFSKFILDMAKLRDEIVFNTEKDMDYDVFTNLVWIDDGKEDLNIKVRIFNDNDEQIGEVTL